jgi:hypothetical protein
MDELRKCNVRVGGVANALLILPSQRESCAPAVKPPAEASTTTSTYPKKEIYGSIIDIIIH